MEDPFFDGLAIPGRVRQTPGLGDGYQDGHGPLSAQITGAPVLREQSNDPLRSLEIGFQGMRHGVASIPGTFIDLTNALMNLGLRGVDLVVPGDQSNLRMSDNPIGGTRQISDLIESVVPGEPYQPEEMTPLQKMGYEANDLGTAAMLPGVALERLAAKQAAKLPFLEPFTQPYNRGATPMSDAAAGVGAGVAASGYEQFTPEQIKEKLGPVGEVIAMLGGATGANLLENVVRGGWQAVTGTAKKIATGGVEADLPLNPDGTFVKSKDADAAALYTQGSASNPILAADTIGSKVNDLSPFGPNGVPTSGVLSDDAGLIAAEKAARLDPDRFKNFTAADQATERAALDNAQKIAPETAIGRQFTDAVGGAHQQRVQAARGTVDDIAGRQRTIEEVDAAYATGLNAQRGNRPVASQALDARVTERLTADQARKNAAFEAIDPEGTVQRPIQPLQDAVSDIEARTGVLNDPAGQPRAMMDRVGQLAEESPTVSFADLNAARPELASQIAAARKAGNYTLADNLQTLKNVIDSETERLALEGGEAGVRAQQAMAEYRDFAQTWARGPGDEGSKFRKDFNLDRTNRTTTPPSQTAERFLQPGQPEKAASLKRIVGNDPAGRRAAGEFLTADLANAGVIKNGRIDPNAVRNWMANWGDEALNLSPEFRKQIDDLLQRSDTNATDAGVLARALKEAEENALTAERDTEAVRAVLGKDPVNAIASILKSGDSERTIEELVRSIDGNEAAQNGLKAAVREYLFERATTAGISRTGTGENPLSFAKLDELFKQHENVLKHIFSPEDMNFLRASHKFLAPLKNLEMRTTVGSQTSPNDRLWEKISKPLEVGLKFRLGVLKGGGVMRTLNLWRQMLPNGDAAAQELISRAWFDPELAKHLLTRDVSSVGSASYNAKLIRLLSYGKAAAPEEEKRQPVEITVRGGQNSVAPNVAN